MRKETTEPVPSYYEASKNQVIDAPVLSGDLKTDVVVIGGGLTGCSTALHLAEAGAEVVQLEAAHYGWGASGRSGGQIINGYSVEQDDLEKMVGEITARELWDHSVEAVEYTLGLIERHKIDCDWQPGYLHVGVKPRHASELEEWAEHLSKHYDYDILQYLDQKQLREILSSELYSGGVADPGSGHLHPLNYCLGVAKAAQNAGANMYQHTRVQKVIQSANGYRVETESGSIECQQVVYACNAYLDRLAPAIGNKIMPVGTYIVATEPLGETVARNLISNQSAVADTNFVLDYYRTSADHRLLFGGRVSYSTLEPRKLTQSLQTRMLRVFPQLAGVKIEFSWGGYVAITRNRAPHIGRQKDGTWFAQGFSGHGMALTGYVGRLLSKAVTGDDSHLKCFYQIPHASFPGGRLLRTPALVAAMSYYRMRDHL